VHELAAVARQDDDNLRACVLFYAHVERRRIEFAQQACFEHQAAGRILDATQRGVQIARLLGAGWRHM
jgi:hypothetical protein